MPLPRLAFMIAVLGLLSLPAQANSQPFQSWLAQLRAEAARKGISQEIINATLNDIRFNSRIIELDRKQPESRMTFAQYKTRVISDARIEKGRDMFRRHRDELNKAAARYGVQPQYIVALWGIETSFGENTGGFDVVSALATLAYDGRRSSYFRGELFKALKILDQGHISPSRMKGSWAGAMGQNQFMPSSFEAFAVDGNGDGRRDIWTSLPDVFASTANYLGKSGWNDTQTWGRRVKVPQGLPKNLTGLERSLPLAAWSGMGVTQYNGQPLPREEGMKASLVMPDGAGGPAYLVYGNYKGIMKWNKSTYFATSVGLLADEIAR